MSTGGSLPEVVEEAAAVAPPSASPAAGGGGACPFDSPISPSARPEVWDSSKKLTPSAFKRYVELGKLVETRTGNRWRPSHRSGLDQPGNPQLYVNEIQTKILSKGTREEKDAYFAKLEKLQKTKPGLNLKNFQETIVRLIFNPWYERERLVNPAEADEFITEVYNLFPTLEDVSDGTSSGESVLEDGIWWGSPYNPESPVAKPTEPEQGGRALLGAFDATDSAQEERNRAEIAAQKQRLANARAVAAREGRAFRLDGGGGKSVCGACSGVGCRECSWPGFFQHGGDSAADGGAPPHRIFIF